MAVSPAAGLLLVAVHGVGGVGERGVAQRGDDAVLPVEVLGGHAGGGVLQILRGGIDVRVERHEGVERVGTVGDPLQGAAGLRTVRADLHDGQLALTVDADRAEHVAGVFVAQLAVRIVGGALVVRAEHVLDVLDGDLAFRLAGPRDVVAHRLVVGVRTVPHLVVRVEEALHDPGARRVVDVVGVGVGAERVARVERGGRLHGQVQMVLGDPLGHVGGAHVVLLVAQGVLQIELVDAQLIRHRDVRLVRHALGDPMVAADGLQPPDLVDVGERDAVHLIGAVLLQQRAQAQHTLTRGLDIRQDQRQEILLADAAGDLGHIAVLAFLALGRHELHERVGAQHALVGGQGLGGAHRHVGLVHAGLAPDALLEVRVRHGGVSHRIIRQVDLHVAQHAAVPPRLLLGFDDDESLRAELAVRRILVAGDDRGAVVAGILADQNRGAGHVLASFRCAPSPPWGGRPPCGLADRTETILDQRHSGCDRGSTTGRHDRQTRLRPCRSGRCRPGPGSRRSRGWRAAAR